MEAFYDCTVCFPPAKAQGKGHAEITVLNIMLRLIFHKVWPYLTSITEVKTDSDPFCRRVVCPSTVQPLKVAGAVCMVLLAPQGNAETRRVRKRFFYCLHTAYNLEVI